MSGVNKKFVIKSMEKVTYELLPQPGKSPIIPGPGTVPTSQTSTPVTNVSEMIKELRRAVEVGTFEKEDSVKDEPGLTC